MRACLHVCPAFQYVDRFPDLRVDETWHYELCTTGEHDNIRLFRSWNVVWYKTLENMQLLRDFLTLEMGPIGCPETSVRNYHYSLRKNPEKWSPNSAFVKVTVCRIFSKIIMTVQNVLFLGSMMLTDYRSIRAANVKPIFARGQTDKPWTQIRIMRYVFCNRTIKNMVTLRELEVIYKKRKVYTIGTEVMKYLQKQNEIIIIIMYV